MKRSIGIWQLMGFAVTSFVGTILHFLYDWFGEASFIAPFSSVNESTWEHMKILFWPMFIFAIIQGLLFNERKDFWCVKLKGILLGLVSIPIIFYTYNGVIGKSPDCINISIFFIAAAITYFYEAKKLYKSGETYSRPALSFTIILSIAMLFILFTFILDMLNGRKRYVFQRRILGKQIKGLKNKSKIKSFFP